jgi:hypothetical protein
VVGETTTTCTDLLNSYSTGYAGEEKAHQKLICGILYLQNFANESLWCGGYRPLRIY